MMYAMTGIPNLIFNVYQQKELNIYLQRWVFNLGVVSHLLVYAALKH